jgi:ABC-type Zn uptake system ZnuABC Zn-binding protein ZnuA
MNTTRTLRSGLCSAASLLLVAVAFTQATPVGAEPLVVCATVPELGRLVETIGGSDVKVTVFAKPTEDPHFVDARPSFVRALNRADLLVLNGLELEIGWLPALIQNARNAQVLPGASGYVDASVAIQPMNVPAVRVDRSMGDVHPMGNPHYLLDPVNGLKAAALLRDRMSALRPAQTAAFAEAYDAFKKRLAERLAGKALADLYDIEKLALLQENAKLLPFLSTVERSSELGGWWGRLLPYGGIKVVQDHRIWPYFARRFGLRIVADMEPKPGIAPTTHHMKQVAEIIRAQHVPIAMTAAYYDPKYGDFLARETGLAVARMANQAGARPGTDDYLDMVGFNVDQIADILERQRGDQGS